MKKLILLLLSLGVVGLASVHDAQGTSPIAAWADCGWMDFLACANNKHKTWADAGGNIFNMHDNCKVCPIGQDCHGSCWPADEDLEVQLAYQSAVEAATQGDVGTLLSLGPSLGRYITYNSDRSAVQLWSCQREFVMASLAVPAEMSGWTEGLQVAQ